MDRSAWADDDENENEDGEVQDSGYLGRDGLIFLIDATMPMFVKEDDGEAPFKISMECCKTTILNKIISSERDMIGVILFGTSKSNNILNVSNISVLQELQQPSADKIKQLENILERKDFDNFDGKFGHSNDFSLSDALWLCQTLFSKCQFKLSSQRVLLFTNTDNPHKSSLNKQHQSRTKAKDLGEIGIDLELLHMGNNFNPGVFYKDLIQLAKGDDSEDWRLPNPSNRFDELLARVCRKDHKKRSVGRMLFTLGDDLELGIAVYNLVRPTPPPKRILLDRTTNEEVKPSTKKFDATTGAVLLPTELKKYQEFGFEKIIFTPEEVQGLRKLVEPGLKLLGFKPASKIKMHHHVKPSSFIYPEEGLVQGSRKMFAALLDRCIKRDKVAICCFNPRTNATPAIVALLPQEERMDSSNVQILPPGFHLVYLPYADDIRKLNIQSLGEPDREQVDKALQVIRKLRFPYSPYQFDNPKLQTLWRNIEALALEHDEPREVKDLTVPDYEYMRKKLGTLSLEYLDLVYPAGFVPEEKPKAAGGRKRALDAQNQKPEKIQKTVDEDSIRETAEFGKVDKLKVDELKAYLMQVGQKVTGLRKGDLVTKVYEHLGIQQPK